MKILSCACAALLVALTGCEERPAVVCHLDPAAAAEGDGSAARPFKTFDAARKAVRAAVADPATKPGEVVVEIAAGRHPLSERIRFTAEDSGTARNPVRWRAARRGETRFTGGVDVPALHAPDEATRAKLPPEARDRVLEADAKAAGIDLSRADAALVWDETFLVPARWPNAGFTGIAKVENRGKGPDGKPLKTRGFVYADDRVGTWADETDGMATGYFMHDWYAATVRIAKIDPAAKTFEQVGDCRHYGYAARGYWYGWNLLREIDRPGEYQFAAKDGKIRVWPPAGKPAFPPQVTAADGLFDFAAVKFCTFEGFVFENCRGEALHAVQCENVAIVACRFCAVGKAAGVVKCRRLRIAGCDAAHCNFGGFFFSQCGDPATLAPADVVVENCHVFDFSRRSPTYTPAVSVGNSCGVVVRRCLFHHGPHVAILFGGRLNRIEANEIHSVCLDSGEMGAIYTGRDWTLCGNEIVGNYVHDVGLGGRGWNPNRAVMLDDGAAGIVVASNRFVRVAEGVSLSAVGNRIECNLFVENYPSVSGWQTWEKPEQYKPSHYTHQSLLDRFHALDVHAEPWKSRFPYLAMMADAERTGKRRDPASNTVIADNVIVGGPEGFFYSWGNHWSPSGWTVKGNVRSKDGKEAEAFLPPLAAIGLYEAPERATWPVENPVVRNDSTKMTPAHAKNYKVVE